MFKSKRSSPNFVIHLPHLTLKVFIDNYNEIHRYFNKEKKYFHSVEPYSAVV